MPRIFLETTRRVSMTQPGLQGTDAVTTRCISVTPPATLLEGWAPLTTRCVSVTQPGPQGPDAVTTRRVSVTPPSTLLGGRAPSTTRRVSVTQPGPQDPDAMTTRRVSATPPATLLGGLGAIYDPACLSDPARASRPGRRDFLASLRDLAKALEPRHLDYSESLCGLTQGFRVGVTESGSITVETSGWPNADAL